MEWLSLIWIFGLAVPFFLRAMHGRAWRDEAISRGLDVDTAFTRGRRITGTTDGVSISVNEFATGNRNQAEFTASYGPGPVPFLIVPETRVSQLRAQGGLIGQLVAGLAGEDVLIGDSAFDGAARIEGDPNALRSLLTPRRKAAILSLFESYSAVKVTNHSIGFRASRVGSDRDRLSAAIDALVRTAVALESREERRPSPSTPTAPSAATGASAPRRTAAADPFDPMGAQAPTSEQIRQGEPTTSRTDRKGRMIFGQSARDGEGAAATDHRGGADHTAIDAVALATVIFTRSQTSIEARDRFDSYRGQAVVWTGTVSHSRADRAEVVVGEVTDPLFGSSSILVHVETDRRIPVGADVRITGTLRAIDYLQRGFELEEATITPR